MIAPPEKLAELKAEVPLAEYTTIRLGGNARYFVSCRTIDEIRAALDFAADGNLPLQILGGGSNVIFPDEGFSGLILKVDLKGVRFEDGGDHIHVYAGAGEVWDDFVKLCIERDLAGLECLSGIPGSVGATPIQNVGAYGQEVKDTILLVRAIDRKSLELVEFSSSECEFGYRKSRFKSKDKNAFVMVEVAYRLKEFGKPEIKYAELREYIKSQKSLENKKAGMEALESVRDTVLTLRRKKSMVVDSNDPNSRSVGSFFVNPILSEKEHEKFLDRLKANQIERAPSFKSTAGIKIPAAWLVENSGFHKGYRKSGVGISSNHALALVNYSGTADELLSLAADIENAVSDQFGIKLEREAVVVQ